MPAEQRRTAILQVAIPLVRKGGRAVTTKEIAYAAGVAEGTVFHVFGDKESLIQAVVESEFEPGRVLAELRAIDPAATLYDRLVLVVEVLGRRLTGLFELMTSLGMHRPPDSHREDGRPAHHELMAFLTELLQPDAEQLRYSPEQTATLIRLFTFAASHPSITDYNPLAPQQIADVLLCGITTHPACTVEDLVDATVSPTPEGPTC